MYITTDRENNTLQTMKRLPLNEESVEGSNDWLNKIQWNCDFKSEEVLTSSAYFQTTSHFRIRL